MAHTFLSLNGWELPARDGTVSKSIITIGDDGNSWSNKPFSNRKKYARQWTLDFQCQSQQDADSIECMVNHGGHYFSFENTLATTTGILPDDITGSFEPVFVDWAIGRAAFVGAGSAVVYDLDLKSDSWTAFFFESSSTSVGFDGFYAARSDGFYWDNGLTKISGDVNDAIVVSISVQNGGFVIQGDSLNNSYVGKILIYPYPLSDSAVEGILGGFYDNQSNVSIPSPSLVLDGSIVNDKRVNVFGDVSSQSSLQFGSNAGWVNNGRNLSVVLTEDLNPIRRSTVYPTDDFAMRFSSTTMPKRPLWSINFTNGRSTNSAEGGLPNLTVSGTPTTSLIPFLKKSDGNSFTSFTSPGSVAGSDEWVYTLQGSTICSFIAFFNRNSDSFSTERFFLLTSGGLTIFAADFEEDVLRFYARPNTSSSLVNAAGIGVGVVGGSNNYDWQAAYFHVDFLSKEVASGGARFILTGSQGGKRGEIESFYQTSTTGLWTGSDRLSLSGAGFMRIMAGGIQQPDVSMGYFGAFQNKKMNKSEIVQSFYAFMNGNFF